MPLCSFCQDKDKVTYELFDDIRKMFHIEFLNEAAEITGFRDSTGEASFIQASKKYLSDKDIHEMFDKNENYFSWDKSRIKEVCFLTADSLLKINLNSKEASNIFFVSAPIFDSTRQYAVVQVFQQRPDEFFLFGGGCVYLFHFSDAKWQELLREACIDY